jgi:hypothetical protein
MFASLQLSPYVRMRSVQFDVAKVRVSPLFTYLMLWDVQPPVQDLGNSSEPLS